jgi:exosome complex component RRP4
LVRRLKSHFIALPCGVDLILGLNGYIWVSKHIKESDQEGEEGFDAEAVYSNQNDVSNEHILRNYLLSFLSLTAH